MTGEVVLSCYQVRPMLAARGNQEAVLVSLDLGLSENKVAITQQGTIFPNGETLAWSELKEIAETDVACFRVENHTAHKIQIFSEETRRFYSLMPTEGAPTMLLSGIPMHRIKGIDPHRDTLLKLRAIKPVAGAVLDTTMGLGYTAIEAARTAQHVTTIELDPAVPLLVRHNPWSRELFDNPKITQMIGDSYEVIETFSDGVFSRVIHDPPMFSLAGDLYSGEFYRQLFRVLSNGGRLFHYVGDLESSSGSRTAKGAARRLQEAGFMNVKYEYKAFGLTALKSSR